jgi:hypothetical protein
LGKGSRKRSGEEEAFSREGPIEILRRCFSIVALLCISVPESDGGASRPKTRGAMGAMIAPAPMKEEGMDIIVFVSLSPSGASS